MRISSCCKKPIIEDTDLCSKCKKPCKAEPLVFNRYDLKAIIKNDTDVATLMILANSYQVSLY